MKSVERAELPGFLAFHRGRSWLTCGIPPIPEHNRGIREKEISGSCRNPRLEVSRVGLQALNMVVCQLLDFATVSLQPGGKIRGFDIDGADVS